MYKKQMYQWLDYAQQNFDEIEKAKNISEIIDLLWSLKTDLEAALNIYEEYAKEVLHND